MTRWSATLGLVIVPLINCVVNAATEINQDTNAAQGQTKGSKLPIFFFHGLGGNATASDNFLNLTAEGRVFHALSFCENACSFGPLQYQVQLAIADIQSVVSKNKTAYAGGCMFVGISQGALIARAVIEEWDDHNVKALVSLADPQNGLFYGPQPSDFASLSILVNIYGPLVVNPSLFSFVGYAYDDYFGKLQRAMSEVFIKPPMQNTTAIFDMIYYPVKTPWLQGHPFFASANNINSCTPSDKDCSKAQQRRRNNFLKLHATHFFGSPQDDFVAPWQSSILGHYTDVSTTEQIETRFSLLKVLAMQQTPEYKQDTYGLKTLAASFCMKLRTSATRAGSTTTRRSTASSTASSSQCTTSTFTHSFPFCGKTRLS